MNREMVIDGTPVAPQRPRRRPVAAILLGLAVAVGGGLLAVVQAGAARRTAPALSALPRGVTVEQAEAQPFRAERRYIGVVEPWLEARVGPQLISAWVDTVLVRPGDRVKRGDLLATLDCRSTKGTTESVALKAQSLEEHQRASAGEAARIEHLVAGGFVSANEVELKRSQAASDGAQLEAMRAELRARAVENSDCTLRAPFSGEVAIRAADPGTFVRPGATVVTVVDRSVMRVVVNAPEVDFALLEVGAPVELTLLANGAHVDATISRRAPAAEASTRSVEFEVDLPSPAVPTGTTADVRIKVGKPVEAVQVPLLAAKVRGQQATVFTVDPKGVVTRRTAHVLGERRGALFLDGLPAKSLVVTEGRTGLDDGVVVAATVAPDSSVRTQ